jgi:hypothetical protein
MSKLSKWILSRREIRPRVFVLLFLSMAGCATSTAPAPPSDRFVRTRQIDGCWKHVDPREYNIVLGSGLEQRLRAQLAGRVLETPQCWFQDRKGQIFLLAGEECYGYDEFTFRKVEGTWKLVNSVRQDLIMCHERNRR